MVHETHTEFKPGSAFVGRLTSNPLWLAVVLLIIAGGAVFWFMMSRGSAGSKTAAPTAQAESRDVNTGGPRSAPANPAAPSAAQAQVNAPTSVTSNGNTVATTSCGFAARSLKAAPASSSNAQSANTPARPDTGQSTVAALKTNGAATATSSRTPAGTKLRRAESRRVRECLQTRVQRAGTRTKLELKLPSFKYSQGRGGGSNR